jgi:hypothetical protein
MSPPAAILFFGNDFELFSIVHHLPTQSFVVGIEGGFVEQDCPKSIHSDIVLLLPEHNIGTMVPEAGRHSSPVGDVPHGGIKDSKYGSVLPAMKCANVAPEGPADVCSFILDQSWV